MFTLDPNDSRLRQVEALTLHLTLAFLEKGDDAARVAVDDPTVRRRLIANCRATAEALVAP